MTEAPWIKSYPKGVRWDAKLPTMPLQEILEESAKKWADKPAVEFMGRRITYRELNDLANRAAKGFQNLGVKPGIHVGLYLPNTPHYLIAFFGVMKAGGTAVNYSPLDAERVLEHKVEDSQTDFLVTLNLKALYPQMGRLLGKTRLKKLIVGDLAEMSGAPDMVRGQMTKTDQLASVANDDRHLTFQQLLENDGSYQAYPIPDLKEAIAVLQYTGGTTGLPKGAMLTHANLSSATSQYVESTRTEPPVLEEGQERILAVLPPFHIYALTVNMLLGLRLGAELVLHMRFDVEAVVKDIASKKITSFPGVPTMYVAIINYPGIEKIDVSSLKWCASGGAPLPVEVQQRFQQITGGHVHAAARCGEARLLRYPHSRHHDQIRQCRGSDEIRSVRRQRRDRHRRPERHARLLEKAGSHRRRDDAGWFHADGRRRLHGRGRLHLYRRPH
jgi:long-chain acyl-CoA synthetase